jgi:hypothetical protein
MAKKISEARAKAMKSKKIGTDAGDGFVWIVGSNNNALVRTKPDDPRVAEQKAFRASGDKAEVSIKKVKPKAEKKLTESPRPKARPEKKITPTGNKSGEMPKVKKVSAIETEILTPADKSKPTAATVKEITDAATTALNRAEKTRADYEKKKTKSNTKREPSSGKSFTEWFKTNKSKYKKDSGGYDMQKALKDFNASRRSGYAAGGSVRPRTGHTDHRSKGLFK